METQTNQVMVIETNEEDAQASARALAQVEGTTIALLTPSLSYALQKIRENPPDLLVIDENVQEWQHFCEEVRSLASQTKIVVTTDQGREELEQEAYGVGATAILLKPLASIQEELPKLFQPASSGLSWSPDVLPPSPPKGATDSGGTPWTQPSSQNPSPHSNLDAASWGQQNMTQVNPNGVQGRVQGIGAMPPGTSFGYAAPPRPHFVVSIYSPKGGVGKTTMSLNLAVALRKVSARYLGESQAFSVGLVDFDVDFGDVAASLQLVPRGSTVDWPKEEKVNPDYVKNLFTFHPPSGLAILAGPDRPEMEFMLDETQARHVITGTYNLFDIVVVDMGYSLRKSSLLAMSMASLPLFVTTPDTPAVRDMTRAKRSLEEHNINLQQAQLILNKVPKKGRPPLSTQEVKRYIGLPVLGEVEEDPKVLEALSEGVPLTLQGKSPAAVEMERMAEALLQDYLPKDEVSKPSLLKRWFGGKSNG